MGFLEKGLSAIGRLLVVASLAATFLVGMLGVVYLQLKGEEVEIPKVVGKNFNDGQDELASYGLRIKKIASRYSEEKPNTILEQRPRAGTTGKSGLMISVVVSQENPDGSEAPTDLKDDEDAIEEIEELPELKTEKVKKKKKTKPKKTASKTRDVIPDKSKENDEAKAETAAADSDKKPDAKKADKKAGADKKTPGDKNTVTTSPKPKTDKAKPKTPAKTPATAKPTKAGDTRPRKAKKSN